ncbi:MAG: tryptophan synthase subunit alpha [Dehalococcoidia bacterium]|nr:tryptophan synthase subunit alpha [Dehalococcoidia bacterium]
MSRIATAFEHSHREGRPLLVGYLTVGYPTFASTLELVPALLDGGFDAVELGVPFSDPIGEGPTIQRSSQGALEQGVTLTTCLDTARRLRDESGVQKPLLLMGYYNPFLAYGLPRLTAAADDVGLDGFIVPDLPPEEGAEMSRACQPHGLDIAYLAAATSTPKRLGLIAASATGFIYCVSLLGVTGARNTLSDELPGFVGRVRSLTSLPLAVGFGISTPEHVAAVAQFADGAIIGSALIDLLDRTPVKRHAAAVRAYAADLRSAAGG